MKADVYMPRNAVKAEGKDLADQPVREHAGRETISCYEKQFKAAGVACLELLDDSPTDRVYCDYHDDYVKSGISDSTREYEFHQVKTKKNSAHQWSLLEVFGVSLQKKEQDPERVKNSFAGKLFEHILNFGPQCLSITLTTNIHTKDDVLSIATKSLTVCGPLPKKLEQLKCKVLGGFEEAFKKELTALPDKIQALEALLDRFNLEANLDYLSEDIHIFEMYVDHGIHSHSEIDLTKKEAARIATELLQLVREKSSGELLASLSPTELEQEACVTFDDLLALLPISMSGFVALKDGGDPKALRNASILNRMLSKAGANESQIEYCSRVKTEWDAWIRQNRHTSSEFLINELTIEINKIAMKFSQSSDLQAAYTMVKQTHGSSDQSLRDQGLSPDIIFGGVWSEIVRNEL